jgi:two-component system OmpR family response regulator
MRIVLIEDDLRIASFIEKGLNESGFRVRHAANGGDGLDLVLNENFDLGVIDLMLPGINGLTIIDRMRENKISFPVIILSARRSLDDRIRGLQHGGDDYMTKPFSFSELLARIQALLRRSGNGSDSNVLKAEDLEIDLLARSVTRNSQRVVLQPKEFALLEYLVRNQGHVVSKAMIIERVWNYNVDPNTNIVEARISKIREKIDRDFEFPLIHTVRGLGYVLKKAEV